MDDTISRSAALDAMETWDKFGCDPDGKLVRYDDDKHYIPYVHYEDMVHAIKNLPPAQLTLYGYDIKVLAFVASVMAKEGMSTEEAVTTFGDINRVIEIMLDDMREGARRRLEQMVAEVKDGTV